MNGSSSDYTPRFVDGLLDELMSELSAVMVIGPRACGKTTTAARRARTIVRLDEPNVASVFHAAPDVALAAAEPPVLLDEWQEVPEVLGAVKRAVDSTPGPGRFLLTGSVRARHTAEQWAGTGRVTPVEMFGLTVAEQRGASDSRELLDTLFGATAFRPALVPNPPDLANYLDLVLRGGFPEAVRLGDRARAAWLEGYLDQLVRRDAPNVAPVRSPGRLMAVLRTLAVCTAGSPTETTLAAAAGVDVRTLRAYLDLLEDLRIIERLPAWHSNRLTRLVKSPKYHVIDPGLAAVLMGVDRMAALRNGDALGRLLETFVVAQLRPLLRLGAVQVGMTHLRDRGGDHEVDLVLETRSGDVIAIEVKAAGRVQSRDAAHLVWLRDRLEDQFRLGVVFYTGAAVVPLGDRIVALPIAAMWSPAALHSVTA